MKMQRHFFLTLFLSVTLTACLSSGQGPEESSPETLLAVGGSADSTTVGDRETSGSPAASGDSSGASIETMPLRPKLMPAQLIDAKSAFNIDVEVGGFFNEQDNVPYNVTAFYRDGSSKTTAYNTPQGVVEFTATIASKNNGSPLSHAVVGPKSGGSGGTPSSGSAISSSLDGRASFALSTDGGTASIPERILCLLISLYFNPSLQPDLNAKISDNMKTLGFLNSMDTRELYTFQAVLKDGSSGMGEDACNHDAVAANGLDPWGIGLGIYRNTSIDGSSPSANGYTYTNFENLSADFDSVGPSIYHNVSNFGLDPLNTVSEATSVTFINFDNMASADAVITDGNPFASSKVYAVTGADNQGKDVDGDFIPDGADGVADGTVCAIFGADYYDGKTYNAAQDSVGLNLDADTSVAVKAMPEQITIGELYSGVPGAKMGLEVVTIDPSISAPSLGCELLPGWKVVSQLVFKKCNGTVIPGDGSVDVVCNGIIEDYPTAICDDPLYCANPNQHYANSVAIYGEEIEQFDLNGDGENEVLVRSKSDLFPADSTDDSMVALFWNMPAEAGGNYRRLVLEPNIEGIFPGISSRIDARTTDLIFSVNEILKSVKPFYAAGTFDGVDNGYDLFLTASSYEAGVGVANGTNFWGRDSSGSFVWIDNFSAGVMTGDAPNTTADNFHMHVPDLSDLSTAEFSLSHTSHSGEAGEQSDMAILQAGSISTVMAAQHDDLEISDPTTGKGTWQYMYSLPILELAPDGVTKRWVIGALSHAGNDPKYGINAGMPGLFTHSSAPIP